MALCDGDVTQYNIIRFGTVDIFLIKLLNFATKKEAQGSGQSGSMPFG
jgi:hypothetical protein